MRDWINLLEAVHDPLDDVLGQIGNYIQHNADADFKAVSEALKEYGYVEPVKGSEFFRAIFHNISGEDRERFETVGDMYVELQREVRFDLNREQGFTTTMDKALDFIRGTVAMAHEGELIHTPDTPLTDLHDLIVIYSVVAPDESILFSMRGLKKFLSAKAAGPGWQILDRALNDMWNGYGSDDEVVIDTSGREVASMSLYDSDEA